MHTATLVHITPDSEQLIAYMARVSNPANQSNPDATRLIKYLIKHKHWSPFEMVNMCVEIQTTRSIAAQILRHRSFSFQEFSQRYAQVADRPSSLTVRRQDTTNRQNSIDDLDDFTKQDYQIKAKLLYDHAYNLYQDMIDHGIAKECAREALPLSSPTRLYMNGTLRSWLHYTDLRSSNGTQLEHKLISDSVKELILNHTPLIYDAYYGNEL